MTSIRIFNSAGDVIDQQVNHLARLIDDLLDVARITRDKIRVAQGKATLGRRVLNGALASSRTVIEAHDQSVRRSLCRRSRCGSTATRYD